MIVTMIRNKVAQTIDKNGRSSMFNHDKGTRRRERHMRVMTKEIVSEWRIHTFAF